MSLGKRQYRVVFPDSDLWLNEDVTAAQTLLMLALTHGPTSSPTGLVKVQPRVLSLYCRSTAEQILADIDELHSLGLLVYDATAKMVYVVGTCVEDQPASAHHAIGFLRAVLLAHPLDGPARAACLADLQRSGWDVFADLSPGVLAQKAGLGVRVRGGSGEGPGRVDSNPNPNPNPNPNSNTTSSSISAPAAVAIQPQPTKPKSSAPGIATRPPTQDETRAIFAAAGSDADAADAFLAECVQTGFVVGGKPITDWSDACRKHLNRSARKIPPSPEEVRAFFASLDSSENEAFFDYNTSRGWRIGSLVMKDWQAAARGWVRRSREFRAPERKPWQASANTAPRDPVASEPQPVEIPVPSQAQVEFERNAKMAAYERDLARWNARRPDERAGYTKPVMPVDLDHTASAKH